MACLYAQSMSMGSGSESDAMSATAPYTPFEGQMRAVGSGSGEDFAEWDDGAWADVMVMEYVASASWGAVPKWLRFVIAGLLEGKGSTGFAEGVAGLFDAAYNSSGSYHDVSRCCVSAMMRLQLYLDAEEEAGRAVPRDILRHLIVIAIFTALPAYARRESGGALASCNVPPDVADALAARLCAPPPGPALPTLCQRALTPACLLTLPRACAMQIALYDASLAAAPAAPLQRVVEAWRADCVALPSDPPQGAGDGFLDSVFDATTDGCFPAAKVTCKGWSAVAQSHLSVSFGAMVGVSA